jgi:Transposase DDE domain
MSISDELYTRVFSKLRELHPEPHVKRIANWVWVVVGLILSQSVHLSQIAQHIPSQARAAGRIAQVRRWLANRFINVPAFYRPLITEVLQGWAKRDVFVILDGCSVNHETLQFFRLSLSHCFRALPLIWLVKGPGLITMEKCAALLEAAAGLLAQMATVTFLADRGFRDKDWARKCLQLGWNYGIRVANNVTVTLADGRPLAVNTLGVTPGRPRYFQNVRLTAEADWVCHLAVTWTRGTPKQPPELCAIAMNQPAKRRRLHDYLIRMHIEQSFRDDKSGSFDLAATKLTDPERLNHLLLAIAVATLWIYALGQHVLQANQRTQIDPAYKRQLSVFQIGWRTLRRWLTCQTTSLPYLSLRLRPFRLEPAWRKC